MKTNLFNYGVVAAAALLMSACIVAPPQPIGYRMTSSVLPTYVNGQYVGMQPSNYVAPTNVVAAAPPVQQQQQQPQQQQQQPQQQQQVQQQAPVYLQSTTPSVVYVQAPTPVYGYNPYYAPYYPYGPYPYYSPVYGYPWVGGIGLSIGIGGRFRIH